jgi:hypothetical protein
VQSSGGCTSGLKKYNNSTKSASSTSGLKKGSKPRVQLLLWLVGRMSVVHNPVTTTVSSAVSSVYSASVDPVMCVLCLLLYALGDL